MGSRLIRWVSWQRDGRDASASCGEAASNDAAGVAKDGLHDDDRGATALEWALLLVVIAVPAYYVFKLAMAIMVEHYQMIATLNALPLP